MVDFLIGESYYSTDRNRNTENLLNYLTPFWEIFFNFEVPEYLPGWLLSYVPYVILHRRSSAIISLIKARPDAPTALFGGLSCFDLFK